MVKHPPPPLGRDRNPGNARWCESHRRLECTKKRSKYPEPCHAPAVKGTNTCKMHGGHRIDVLQAKGEATITAWSAMGEPATGTRIDASTAVLGMLQQSWMRANLYGMLLERQVVREGDSGPEVTEGQAGETSGLIGYRFGAAGKDGNIYAVTEEARALVTLEAAERDRVVRYAKVAHDMGISERVTAMAEKWGDVVVARLLIIIEGLHLTPAQQELVPVLVAQHLSTIELTAGPAA